MSKQSKDKNVVFTVIVYILVVLLLFGVIGIAIRFASCENDISGMYVKYGDQVITADSDSVTLSYDETTAATLTIGNDGGWGNYSVAGCTVKVINNVSSSSVHDFEYIVSGANLPYSFSGITDFTGVFATNGKDITLSSDGDFEINVNFKKMSEVLKAYYGKTVTMDGEIYLNSYAYFAIQIISPDESETISIPFLITDIPADGVEISPNAIIF